MEKESMFENNIYLSSGMFNADTNLYNACLTKYLESKSYNCYLPQRDGLSVAQLSTYLQKHNPEVANEISCYVPYYFDLGCGMKNAIAVVANMDDLVDIGMTVEVSYASISNLPVVGVRTDIKSPFGNVNDLISINPFPVMQCDVYFATKPFDGEYKEIMSHLDDVFKIVEESVEKLIKIKSNNMTHSKNPVIINILKAAAILFDGIKDIHTEEAMQEVVKRYLENQKFFDSIVPKSITEF
jgi:nucleoside 2-deoxyribosyltransferase